MKRIVILGNSGSGKTTLALRLVDILKCAHIELDSLRFLADWVEVDNEIFRQKVTQATEGESWVLCGNASAVRDIALSRADTVVIFDLPRRVVMCRLLRRTIRRVMFRQKLWSGNRERILHVLNFRNPHQSIIAWAWTQHNQYRHQFLELSKNEMFQGKQFIFVKSRKDFDAILAIAGGRVP